MDCAIEIHVDMGDELALAVGCLAKNSGNLLRERSSASVFYCLGCVPLEL